MRWVPPTPDGPIGNCSHSAMCCFSFHPVKPITTAEGGMVTTNDEELAERLRRFRSHGIVRRPDLGGWYYEISEVGYNYRLTDVQAALGLSQLPKLDRFIARRNEIAARFREALARPPRSVAARGARGLGPRLPPVRDPGGEPPRVFDDAPRRRGRVQVHYVPVHHHPVSADIGIGPGGLPVCDAVYDGLLSLPVFPDLTDEHVEHVVMALARAVDA